MTVWKKELSIFSCFLVLILLTLFWPVFKGNIPFPGDVLIGHYHPWFDIVWQGRAAGYPIKAFSVDPLVQSYPWRDLSLKLIFSGQAPLWNPFNILGMPLSGVGLSAPFYPLNLAFLSGMNIGWALLTILTPVIASLSLFLWLRNLKIDFFASLLSSLAWGISGLLIDKIENIVDAHSFIWLPLGLLAVDKIFNRESRRWYLLLLLVIGLNWLAGYPPQFLIADVILVIWAFFRLWPTRKKLTKFLIIFILSHLVLAFFWLPIAELAFFARTDKPLSPVGVEVFFLPFINLVMLMAPRFFGSTASNNSWLPSAYPGEKLWLGMVILIFSLVGLSQAKKDKLVKFWLMAVVFSALIFLPTPVGTLFKKLNLPFVSSITPMKLAWVFDLGLIFLAAKGLEVWLREAEKHKVTVLVSLLILGLTIGGLWYLGWSYPNYLAVNARINSASQARSVAFRNLVIPSAIFGLTLVITLGGLYLKKFRKIGFTILIFLSTFELTKEASHYINFTPAELIYPSTEIVKFLQQKGPLWRTMVTDPQILPVNTNIIYQIPMVNGYSSLYPYRNGLLIKMNDFELQNHLSGFQRTVFQDDVNNPMLNLLGVKYILSLKPLKEKQFRLLLKEGRTFLYENTLAFPKAWFAQKWTAAFSDLEIAKKLLEVDRAKEIVLEENLSLPSELKIEKAKAEVFDYQANLLVLKTNNHNEGILLVNDAYYPGWKAFVDNREIKILRADFNLRAVVVPQGEHEVMFIYKPESFRFGILISLLSLGITFLFFRLPKKHPKADFSTKLNGK